MKKMILLMLALVCLSAASMHAQVNVVDSVDLEKYEIVLLSTSEANIITDKAVVLQRIALLSTSDSVTLGDHVRGTLIYNTANVEGSDGVSPGTYYNDGFKWVKIGKITAEEDGIVVHYLSES